METITIGFSKPKNNPFPIASWLIRLFNQTKYSHVYMKINAKSLNRTLIYEATGHGGVNFVNYETWSNRTETVKEFTLNINPEQIQKLTIFCVDNAGKPYSMFQLLNIFINYTRKAVKLSPIVLEKNNQGMICSEAIARLLNEVFDIPQEKPWNLYEPRDIEKILENL